jgi:hypothetical protein
VLEKATARRSGVSSNARTQAGAGGIREYATALRAALEEAPVPAGLTNEKQFEREFVMPLAVHLALSARPIKIYSHPWSSKVRCTDHGGASGAEATRVDVGCPTCWSESKRWATVELFGTRHTFDLVARDQNSGETLAVEIKLVSARGGRMPNGDIQRLIGQCALAAGRHRMVIGVCGYRGSLRSTEHDDRAFLGGLDESRVHVVFRQVP